MSKQRPVTIEATPALSALRRITLPMPFPLDHVYVYIAEDQEDGA